MSHVIGFTTRVTLCAADPGFLCDPARAHIREAARAAYISPGSAVSAMARDGKLAGATFYPDEYWRGGKRSLGVHLTPAGSYFVIDWGQGGRSLGWDGTSHSFHLWDVDGEPLECIACGRLDLRTAGTCRGTHVPPRHLLSQALRNPSKTFAERIAWKTPTVVETIACSASARTLAPKPVVKAPPAPVIPRIRTPRPSLGESIARWLVGAFKGILKFYAFIFLMLLFALAARRL